MSLHFPDVPQFRPLRWDGDVMVIVLEHYIRCLTSVGWITLPTGMVSDGLSIPRWAWAIIGPGTGRAFMAGLLHDYLYSKASDEKWSHITRKQADDLFLEAQYHLGIPWPKRHAMHAAVRLAGWRSYKKK
jgi:hypothetical protein